MKAWPLILVLLFALASQLKAQDARLPITWSDGCDYTVSASGHRIIEVQPGVDADSAGVYRVFVVDPASPAVRVPVGDVYMRGIDVLFSPDERWIVVNSYPWTGCCQPILFKQAGGLKYEPAPGMDVDRQVRAFYAKETGDVAGSKSDGIFVKAISWKSDSSAFRLYLSSKYHALKKDLWTAWYDVNTGTAGSPSPGYDFTVEYPKAQNAILEVQLNAIYKVLKARLDPAALQVLVLEERQWIRDRARLDPEGQEDFTRKRVNQLAARVLGGKVRQQ